MERMPNTQYILSLSYGKDSLACLGAITSPGAALCPFLPRPLNETLFQETPA